MSLLTWVVAGILLYWVAIILVNRLGWLPESVNTTGPITTIRTKRGRIFLDRLSQPRRFWRAVANMGVGIAIVVMIGAFLMLLFSAVISVLSPGPEQIQQPQNVLVIPGVNEFLPLEVAPEIIVGLVIGLVIHEGGHGLLCRVEGIQIKSMGVALLAFIPLGAFVEPDEESASNASRGSQIRMFSAGVTGNFIITIIVFALLFGPVAGAIAVAPGAAVGGVLPDSAAEAGGIGDGDRITAVNNQTVSDFDELLELLDDIPDRTVTVELDDEQHVEVQRSLLVTADTPGGPSTIERGSTILEVDGEPVHTMPALRSVLEGKEEATFTISANTGIQNHSIPIGSLAVVDSGPLNDAGIERGTQIVISAIDGEQIISTRDLQEILGGLSPEETVKLEYWADGERQTTEVVLGEGRQGGGFLGVGTTAGITGMQISDFGIQEYPSDTYLALLGGGDPADDPIGVADSFFGKLVVAIFLPLASIVLGGALPYNFPGFTSDTMNFFVVEGSLSGLGGGVFLLANLLFWTGWINLNLGIFNCIPAVPLDGGHILRASLEGVLSRLPVSVSQRTVSYLVTGMAIVMLVSFLLLIFGAGLFS